MRRIVIVCISFLLVLAGAACCLSACSSGGGTSPTDMADVVPSSFEGLAKKTKAPNYKKSLMATVSLSPAYGRQVLLERYSPQTGEWVAEQSYTAQDMETSLVTVDFGQNWKPYASSKWRVRAPAIHDAGPDRETFGEAVANTKVVNELVSCRAAAIMDAESGKLVYASNATKQRKIASMTKMMSAVLLVENKKPSDKIKITKKIWQTEYSFGFSRGDELTSEQVLYGMMLPSANDAAAAAAYGVSGGIKRFAKLMNAKAKEIGCTNTVFANPHGLDEAGAHSTALDVARIGRYIMTSDTCSLVRQAVKTKKYAFDVKVKKTVKKKSKKTGKVKKKTKTIVHAYALTNTNKLLGGSYNALGIKTGYTEGAGCCFCGAFEVNGKVYVTVVMGADTDKARWKDTRTLVKFARYAAEQGFEEFEL